MSNEPVGFYPRFHNFVVELLLAILLLIGAFDVLHVYWVNFRARVVPPAVETQPPKPVDASLLSP